MADEHVQRLTDQNTANIPLWYGEDTKDTFSLATFIQKLDTAQHLLQFTDAITFRYFTQALRGSASAWLDTWLSENRETPRVWSEVKPVFRKAFGDQTSEATFAQKIAYAKLEHFDNDYHKFYAHINRLVKLHCEPFLEEEIELEGDVYGWEEDQVEKIMEIHNQTVTKVHDKLTLEFFLNGLPHHQLQKVATKKLKKPSQIIEFLTAAEISCQICQKKKEAVLVPQIIPQHLPPAAYITPVDTHAPEEAVDNTDSSHRVIEDNTFTQANTYSQAYASKGNYNEGYKTRAKLCLYCRKPNHKQEKCRYRIRDNQPCVTPKGEAYWPNLPNKNVAASSRSDVTAEFTADVTGRNEQPTFSVFHNEVL
jgi:hypothetical protein